MSAPTKTYPETSVSPARVRDLPAQERPRELMTRVGAANLPDAALLALILRGGIRGVSVVDLARDLLKQYGSLTALAETSVDDLKRIKGIGPVKAQVLKAALELARRMRDEQVERAPVRTPEDVAGLLRAEARDKPHELFWVLPLDNKHHLKRSPVIITSGLADASLAHPREVFCEAIRCYASAVVLVHNHPSGDPTPSPEDIRLTRELVAAGKIVGIRVLDHVILGRPGTVGGREYCSVRESGLVEFMD
ncbi:MAG: DNA repair protein RadC [Kiritimatiellaeota bacterium]|nr:DNA repair protein RadC [Kiritimatiellota bacterium]